jgi:DNA-binding NarL/FixJ family response regulator
MEVLRCLAAGMSNREIAQFLGIGYETARVHAKQLYMRLGITETRAAARAVDEGWRRGLLGQDSRREPPRGPFPQSPTT